MGKEGWTNFPGWKSVSGWILPLDSQCIRLWPLLAPLWVSCLLRGNASSGVSGDPASHLAVGGSEDLPTLRAFRTSHLSPVGPGPWAVRGISPPLAQEGCRQQPAKAMAEACGAPGVGDLAWWEAVWCLSQSQTALSPCL